MADTVIKNIRLNFARIWEPKPNLSGALKYGTMVEYDKTDKEKNKVIKNAIENARKAAVDSGKATAAKAKAAKDPIRDGDYEHEVNPGKSTDRPGKFFFNANSNDQPSVVDTAGQPIFDQDEVYSGCWCHLAIAFYYTETGGAPKICASLNHVMKVKDDKRLDGRSDVTEAFAGLIEETPVETSDELE